MFAGVELLHVGGCQALFLREFSVTNEAVGPEVDNINLQLVASRPDCFRDVHAKRFRPQLILWVYTHKYH